MDTEAQNSSPHLQHQDLNLSLSNSGESSIHYTHSVGSQVPLPVEGMRIALCPIDIRTPAYMPPYSWGVWRCRTHRHRCLMPFQGPLCTFLEQFKPFCFSLCRKSENYLQQSWWQSVFNELMRDTSNSLLLRSWRARQGNYLFFKYLGWILFKHKKLGLLKLTAGLEVLVTSLPAVGVTWSQIWTHSSTIYGHKCSAFPSYSETFGIENNFSLLVCMKVLVAQLCPTLWSHGL